MKSFNIQLPVPEGSTRKNLYLVEFDQNEELRVDCSAGISFDNNFLDGNSFIDRFACCMVFKSVDQKFRASVKLNETSELKTIFIDNEIVPSWSEVARIPKSRFDEYGEDFLNNISFKKALCKLISKDNNNVHISIYTEPDDIKLNKPILKKHISATVDSMTVVKKGCIVILQDSSKILINGEQYDNIYYAIAKNQDLEITAISDTNLTIVRLDDTLDTF